MSTVLAMRFNERQALMVADESTWHLGAVLGYRRTNYGDSLSSLFEPGETRRHGLAAVYGGVGFPSFHYEVSRRAKVALAQAEGRESGSGQPRRLDGIGVGQEVLAAYVATHDRMLEDKLHYNYGFGRDALNSRVYRRDDRKLDIGQDLVAEAARSIAAGNARGNAYARFFNNSGLVVTHDNAHGVQCWYVDSRGSHLGFATSIAVLGEGNEVSTHLLSRFIQRRDLDQRRRGFGLEEGLYIAMSIATEIRTSIGKMGGYFQILFIDGEHGVRELVSDAAHLASEVMRAHLWGFIPRSDAEAFIKLLIVEGADDTAVEKELFGRATDAEKLKRYLMGFKPVAAPSSLATDPPRAGRPAPPVRAVSSERAEAALQSRAGVARGRPSRRTVTKGARAARKGGEAR